MKKHSRLQSIFQGMKTRCYNPKDKHYKNYGGRGIRVCDEWNNRERVPEKDNATKGYLAFKKWALENGYADNLTIDRINVNGNYEPSNCRWITHKEQCNNTTRNRLITYKGKTQTVKQWCDELNLPYGAIIQRFCTYHWTAEKAFEEKISHGRRSTE